MKKVRIGVVGVGGMGQGHCSYMERLGIGELTAVCDIKAAVAKEVGEKYRVPYFAAHTKLLDSGLVDAVLIATPHYFHPPVAIDAFKRGIHALSEKPIAVSVSAARRMAKAAEKSGCVFSVMYQMRTEPQYQAAKRLVEEGAIGELVRASIVMGWYRSQAYYDSGGWRATWPGEGGGVLVNQAPHGLDSFVWLAGMPKTLIGRTRTRLHDIEVEDEAWATVEFPNGAHGYLYAGVIEAPGTTRLELVGDRGKILFDDRGLQFWRLKTPISKFTRTSKEMWASPEGERVEVPLPEGGGGHIAITRNFCEAILKGKKLVAPGAEGVMSVELASAMILSSHRNKPVKFPMNAAEYDKLLAELIASAKPKRGVREQRVTDTTYTTGKGRKGER
jgi:predicted dehydrogenase